MQFVDILNRATVIMEDEDVMQVITGWAGFSQFDTVEVRFDNHRDLRFYDSSVKMIPNSPGVFTARSEDGDTYRFRAYNPVEIDGPSKLDELLAMARKVDQLLQPHQREQRDDTPLFAVNGVELTYGDLRKLRSILAKFD